MFADLCGFTKLSREIDAEELHAVLERYFEAVDGIVEGHGGYVDKHPTSPASDRSQKRA